MATLVSLFWWVDYEDFTNFVLHHTGRSDWRAYWETSLFPPLRWQWLRLGLSIIMGIYIVIVWRWHRTIIAYFERFLRTFQALFSYLWHSQRLVWQQHKLPCIGIFSVFLAHSCFNIYEYALQYDEAWTYNNFIQKGFFISTLSPHNNHIFYTILACWADYLPLAGKYALRLPALLGGLLVVYTSFVGLHRWTNPTFANMATTLLAFAPSVCFYSMYARGYIYVVWGLLISIWALWGLWQTSNRAIYSLALWIGTIIGFYAVPTFFYAWASVHLAWLFTIYNDKPQRRSLFIQWIKINIASVAVLLFLYAPFLLTNGLQILARAAESTTQMQHYSQWWYINKMNEWILFGKDYTFLGWTWIIQMLLGIVFSCYFYTQKQLNKLFISLFFTFCNAWLLVAPISTPERAWVFVIVGDVLFLTMLLTPIYTTIRQKWLQIGSWVSVIIILIYNCQTHYHLNWSKKLDKEAIVVSNYICSYPIDEVYTFSRYDKPLLEYYYYQQKKQPLRMWLPFEDSKNYAAFAARPYACVLLDTDDYTPTPSDWQTLQTFDYQLIYKSYRLQLYIYQSH